ncbi:GntR family transcriptional regulator [Candidatus Formimonas warabiya]|uniref:GntR family transcriptional regulator n=1 Tax=Formimonas warabiya TaxID=1761012 RepID=A0A3G1KQN2_FORW1|nr:GntR family transcriptional regulator [Candidatus Formimonas warabiya]ATW24773.1 GntR family transcriptional regulator [Candidatus Formimonas warabiya]
MSTGSFTIDKSSVIPLYYQLAKIFKDQITSGTLQPNQSLPPEYEIAKIYGISRPTVRQAIAELTKDGFVYTLKGKGTFVSVPQLDDISFELDDFRKEIKQRGMKLSSKLIRVEIIKSDAMLEKKIGIPLDTDCLFLKVVHFADDEPLVFEEKYFIYTKNKPILESELEGYSLSNLVSSQSSLFPAMSEKVLKVSAVNQEEAKLLNVELNSPVFLVEQIVFDIDERPIGWGKSIFRGDRYKLTNFSGWHKKDKKL